jgi:drug/metabolite transporter (DMT)-like permease
VTRADGSRAGSAWLGVVGIWSTTPIAIKWTAEGMGPALAVLGRTAIAAAVFALLFLVARLRFTNDAATWRAAAVAAAAFCSSMLLASSGAPLVPSGLMSVVFGLSPLATALLGAFVLRNEPLTPWRAAGTLVGFSGVVLISGGRGELGEGATHGLLLVGAAMCIGALNLVVLKQIAREVSVVSMTALSTWLSLPVLVVAWWLLEGQAPAALAPRVWWSVAWLGVAGSVVGFLLFYYALKHMAATKVALITLVTPLTALLIGQRFNGEHLPPSAWLGSGLVLVGIAFATLLDRRWARG